jgi:prolyl-tRNA synthetase
MNVSEYKKILQTTNLFFIDFESKNKFAYLPLSIEIRTNLFNLFNNSLQKQNYEIYSFPIFAKKSFLDSQKKIEDFSKGILWINKNQGTYLRPSGESTIYPLVKKMINTHKNLPLKIITNDYYFRKNRKQTIPLISGSAKIMFEGHCFFSTKKEVNDEMLLLIKKFNELLVNLGIYSVIVEIPSFGNKKISKKSIGFLSISGFEKPMMLLMIYDQDEIYSELLGIKYINKNDKKENVNQLCFGFTDRIIGFLISLFSSESKLVMPMELIPFSVGIICFLKKENLELIEISNNLKKDLDKIGIKCKIEFSTGREKIYQQFEKSGILINIACGEKEIKENKFILKNSFFNSKEIVEKNKINPIIINQINKIKKEMYCRSKRIVNNKINGATSLLEIKKNMKIGNLSEIGWCGEENCLKIILKNLEGELLGILLNNKLKRKKGQKCIVCKREGYKSIYGKRM